MLRLLKWLIYGDAHLHKWETIKEEAYVREYLITHAEHHITRYTLRCSICGEIKTIDSD